MSLTSQEHRAALEHFSELLSRESYRTQLQPAGDVVPCDTLLVRIESFEEENRVWRCECHNTDHHRAEHSLRRRHDAVAAQQSF
jgi:hypothetical protein